MGTLSCVGIQGYCQALRCRSIVLIFMKNARFVSVACVMLVAAAASAQAQDRIYRCGNEYTNNANDAQARGCKLVEGGNVTVVQSAPAAPAASGAAPVRSPGAAATGAPGQRVASSEQRARDAEARTILEAELKKAEARQAQLLKDYNNGEPEKIGIESRNYARYQERVNEMKAAISRNEADIAGIKRELSRLSSAQ